ncbi:hypothetical protein KUV85_05085 [Nocardioides panacisoli]|uniref:hypothetical protein n=1 Tax=Nocardioides panacisoli TaxID=627624 RepID=UPI001C62DD25|nr:hypothetical protein [Nocardioides panacisoli]QYJ05061.1 hypothetical protein KUV85_05085 [Nocardioides panacisoli]
MSAAWSEVDPFDLPEWLGVERVTWSPDEGLAGGLVLGALTSEDSGEQLPCDLLAADLAHPVPVVAESVRVEVHRAWSRDEVLLASRDGRLTVAAPGTEPSVDQVLEMLRRLAKALGASPERFAARLFLRR